MASDWFDFDGNGKLYHKGFTAPAEFNDTILTPRWLIEPLGHVVGLWKYVYPTGWEFVWAPSGWIGPYLKFSAGGGITHGGQTGYVWSFDTPEDIGLDDCGHVVEVNLVRLGAIGPRLLFDGTGRAAHSGLGPVAYYMDAFPGMNNPAQIDRTGHVLGTLA